MLDGGIEFGKLKNLNDFHHVHLPMPHVAVTLGWDGFSVAWNALMATTLVQQKAEGNSFGDIVCDGPPWRSLYLLPQPTLLSAFSPWPFSPHERGLRHLAQRHARLFPQHHGCRG